MMHEAQEYKPGYFDQYWDGTQLYAQQYDPYYELHEMHYKIISAAIQPLPTVSITPP